MGKVYTTQDNLILYIDTGTDLSSAASVLLEGTDPSGTSLVPFVITIHDADEGILSYEVESTDFATAGTYIFWIKVTYLDGSISYGEPFHLTFYTKGN